MVGSLYPIGETFLMYFSKLILELNIWNFLLTVFLKKFLTTPLWKNYENKIFKMVFLIYTSYINIFNIFSRHFKLS